MNIKNNKSGFSVIVAILITAFLVILSSGVLFLVLKENSNTRIVYNTISSYAGAEGALEYGLLKIKNHKDGFEDNIVFTGSHPSYLGSDHDSKLISSDTANIVFGKDAMIEYEMDNFGKSYTGTIGSGSYAIIPLFGDSGSLMQIRSKNPNVETDIIDKTLHLNVSSSLGVVWNIIGNDSVNGNTFGIAGSGSSFNDMSDGELKTEVNNAATTQAIDFSGGVVRIGNFLNTYESNYLILYNQNTSEVEYNINSTEGFSYPEISIISTASIGDYKQNISFKQDKSEIFELLKYSFFNN
ncbi:MAG: hypothetical protein PHS92_04510 [Candidatus Gracilibacteria bacterium]|nr:hypothetical protein [Candidatus Gracilibacteria bacterium]